MINNINELDISQPGERQDVQSAEQDLLFVGTHSTTGRLMVQFIQGDEVVGVEIQNAELRHKMLGLLIDGLGGELELLRQEAAQS